MRILVVTSQFPIDGEPHRGRPILQTVRALAGMASVRVLSPVASYPHWAQPRSYLHRPAVTLPLPGLEVAHAAYPALPLLSRGANGLLCARAVAAALREDRPDVVLAYWLYPDAYGAVEAAEAAGLPVVVGARGSDLRVRDALSRWLTRRMLRRADRVLTVSEDLRRIAITRYGVRADAVHTIPNGCDAAIFHPRGRGDARASLGVEPNAELVLYVGRLVPGKGLDELFEAFGNLRRRRPRLQLALVGDGPMRGELDRRGRATGAGCVRTVGSQPATVVASWMAAADLVTLPSHSEGHPNVLVEALACGRPVVATCVGGIPEVVDAECGVLVPPRDSAALATALDEVLERAWVASRLAGRFCRDWAQVARETLHACEQAMHSHAAQPGREQPACAE